MKIITGERIQEWADISFSKKDHTPFELNTSTWIDIDTFNPSVEFDNPYFIYANSSLINRTKPVLLESKFVEKLQKFKNPFVLILHNSDQNFLSKHLDIFDITKVEKIYSQNVLVNDERVVPLPIGLANRCWEWGNVEFVELFLKDNNFNFKKSNNIYFNFTVEGGARDEKRPSCFNALTALGIPWIENKKFTTYIQELASYKFIVSPQGNGIDCHRTWEALYLKTIPVVDRNATTEFYAQYFPIFLVDDWDDISLDKLVEFELTADWSNYELLDINCFKEKFVGKND